MGTGRSEVKEEARPQAGPGDMSEARYPWPSSRHGMRPHKTRRHFKTSGVTAR